MYVYCRYEGTGRSLSLKLMRELEKSCTAGVASAPASVADTKKSAKIVGSKPQPTSLSSSNLFESLFHSLHVLIELLKILQILYFAVSVCLM